MRIGPFTFLLALSFASALLSQSTLAQTTKLPARKPAAPAATATPAKPTDAPQPQPTLLLPRQPHVAAPPPQCRYRAVSRPTQPSR